jgi:L-lactate dehydrogenase (cytochrome)
MEYTLRRNVEDLGQVALRQRVLKNMSALSRNHPFGEKLSMPVALAPVGLCGMYARGEEGRLQGRRMRKVFPLPYRPYPFVRLKRSRQPSNAQCGFSCMFCATADLCAALERAKAAGCSTLVFTVDMPTPGAIPRRPFRHEWTKRRIAPLLAGSDASSMGVGCGAQRSSARSGEYLHLSGETDRAEDYIGWLANNFDPSISGKTLSGSVNFGMARW